MNYNQQHLLKWLMDHNCINTSCVEKACKIPKDTLRHFIKQRRKITEDQFKKISFFLENYGYKPLEN